MRKLLVLGAVIAATGGVALAEDSLTACQEFAARNGVDAGPCECIAAAVSGDATLQAEQIALATMDDFQNASAELRAALDPCVEG